MSGDSSTTALLKMRTKKCSGSWRGMGQLWGDYFDGRHYNFLHVDENDPVVRRKLMIHERSREISGEISLSRMERMRSVCR